MSARSVFRGTIWTLIAIALVAHIAGGWYLSDQLIEDDFVPNPAPIVAPIGNFRAIEVEYDSPLGSMTAFHLPASGTTWVIHVHGKGQAPDQAKDLFAPLQKAGYSQLSIAYRNDENHPLDPSGYYQYGATEWEDLAGALEFAKDNGARAVVFSGFGSGSSHILSFIYRHNLDIFHGLILDAPNIDMGDTVDFSASQRKVPAVPINYPPTVAWVAKFIISLRIGVNWKSIDYVENAEGSLRVPVLVHHGADDETVPLTQSKAFVEASPDLVQLVEVPGAGHVGSYEADPEKYVDDVLSFLRKVG